MADNHVQPNEINTILLVDDNEMVMDITRDILEDEGYQVVSTFLPSVALQLIENKSISVDLLLTDVVMPQMNGPDMYRHMKELLPELPVLYMSGYSDHAIHGVMMGEKVEYLAKPFNSSSLLQRVARLLGVHSHDR